MLGNAWCRGASTSWLLRTHLLAVLLLALFAVTSDAGFIDFENCLSDAIVNSDPRQLQFVPYFFSARFDTVDPLHPLNITVYGNVTGQAVEGTYPPPDSPDWQNPNETFGKIVPISPITNVYTTLFERYQFLSYDATDAPPTQFCPSTINSSCPLGPSFNGSPDNPYSLSAFTVEHNLNSSYAFGTVATTIRVRSGDPGAPDIICVSASITPDLGMRIAGLLRYLPVVVLTFVGLAVAAAAIFSPWGTSDPFKWTTNYGRDQDLLRLVTPGFGDCLQYIQFVFLTGALSLSYPGFYQPATSQLDWSALMFNASFVTHGNGYDVLRDGIYSTNGTYGLTRTSQLIGMTSRNDVWASMAVWLAVLCLTAVVLCQLTFLIRWAIFKLSDTTEEDLRHKNWPLTGGMLIRVVYNYFLLPIVALSVFQLLIAPSSPFYMVIVSTIVLFSILILALWILWVLIRTKPRALLFDDLPTLLLYGSLYNTYNDERALFSIIPVVLTVMRGIAIGAVQPTGIAQLIILAICEVVFILTVHAFRPFSSPTHMNFMHTTYSAVRLVTVLLMVAFLPSLGVSEASKGWIGYIILALHALVLVFGFFLNAIQTLVEVAARMAGAGGDEQHGAHRGALISYSFRQLRHRRSSVARPGSMASDALMLTHDRDSKLDPNGRARSLSASSRMLLSQRMSTYSSLRDGPSTPGVESPLSGSFGAQTLPSGSNARFSQVIAADPYYRPPRARKGTMDSANSQPGQGGRRRTLSNLSGEWASRANEEGQMADEGHDEHGNRESATSPAFFRRGRAESDADLADQQPSTDYAVREVDFYYGVTRGPALSSMPSRKRKTGPADPMGPVSNATTWIHRLVGGKKKDKQKGFEVVRSARARPPGLHPPMENPEEEGAEMQTSPPMHYPPYRDAPEMLPNATNDVEAGTANVTKASGQRMPLDGGWESDESTKDDRNKSSSTHSPSPPPLLQPILRSPSLSMTFLDSDTIGLATSSQNPRTSVEQPTTDVRREAAPPPSSKPGTSPNVPRRSSRRSGSKDLSPRFPAAFDVVDRPTSMGTVSRGLTRASVHKGQAGHIPSSSAAEIVDGPSSPVAHEEAQNAALDRV